MTFVTTLYPLSRGLSSPKDMNLLNMKIEEATLAQLYELYYKELIRQSQLEASVNNLKIINGEIAKRKNMSEETTNENLDTEVVEPLTVGEVSPEEETE